MPGVVSALVYERKQSFGPSWQRGALMDPEWGEAGYVTQDAEIFFV